MWSNVYLRYDISQPLNLGGVSVMQISVMQIIAMQITVMPVAITKWQLLLRPTSLYGKGFSAYFVLLFWG